MTDFYFLNCKTLEEFKFKMMKYYYLPPIERDNPAYGNAWVQKVPEAAQYDPFFKYDHNSYGFRDTEVEDNVDICYYGCSMTVGIGVPVETRWTNIIDSEFGYKSNNFAISGLGAEEMLKIFLVTSKFIKMKKAAFLFPDFHRYIMPIRFENNDLRYPRFHPNFEDLYTEPEILHAGKHLYSLPDEFFYDRFRISLDIIIEFARIQNIKLYLGSWSISRYEIENLVNGREGVYCIDSMEQDRKGRDCVFRPMGEHPGIESHKNFAQGIIDSIYLLK